MKRFSEQLQSKANTLKLKAAEKQVLRERIVSYMEYHPLSEAQRAKSTTALPLTVPEVQFLEVEGWKLFKWSGAVLGMLLISITYLAEQAVPGDSLYAVKVSFNEEVRSTLAWSPYEKVVWETERLNRRVAEARLLASEGRLTEAVEVEVVKAIKVHSDNARREIEVLKQTDKEEAAIASIQLETSIDVQTTSLKSNNLASSTEGKSTALLATALAESSAVTGESNTEETLPSYERLTAHVERETTRAYELLNSIGTIATTEERADITRRMEDIERSLLLATAQVSENEVTARQELVSILQRTQRLIVFMTNIDIRQSVTVEEIVPVTLTSDERRAIAEATAKKTIALAEAALIALEASSTEPAYAEKFTGAVEESKVVAEAVLAEIVSGVYDLTTVEEKLKAGEAIMLDVAAALGLRESNLEVTPLSEPVVEDVVSTTTEEVGGEVTASSSAATSTEAEVVTEETPV